MKDATSKFAAILFLFTSIFFQTIAIYFGKVSANHVEFGHIITVLLNPYYIASLMSLMVQAFFWHLTLKRIELSVAYPSTSIVFIFIIFISYYVFKEDISINNLMGIAIMMVGVIVLNK
ncbi:EamA family transporter [Paenibacillus sp. FSL H8-0034]|uniref:EamA family transporter n=1 Tax=Paenibacillus sp. FSL H8-0034 TaxID=2954671 RepID=UPI0030FA5DE4